MGTFGDGSNAKKGKSRGATNVPRSLAGLGQGGNVAGAADWNTVEWSWVRGIVVELTRRGGAASFGLSRDKGAYNVTLFLDGGRETVWISSGEDVDAKLEEICHYIAALPHD